MIAINFAYVVVHNASYIDVSRYSALYTTRHMEYYKSNCHLCFSYKSTFFDSSSITDYNPYGATGRF